MPDTTSTTTTRRPRTHRDENYPVSVWATAQQSSRGQRIGRYTRHSVAHPAKMMPAIARHMIEQYTEPGEIVLDPMCGIGTTLVEAIHLGRDGLGVEYEQRWAQYATENVALNHDLGATGRAEVIHADARTLPDIAPAHYRGQVSLVITSPPYGASLHGQVSAEKAERGSVKKFDYRYSTDKGNLAHVGRDHLIDGFAAILAGCVPLLKPGGIVAVTARPWRERGQLVDLPTDVFKAGAVAGLEPVERTVALLAAVRDGGLILRPSFFQLSNLRKDRERGIPHHLIIHEDVLILRKGSGDKHDPVRGRAEADGAARSAGGRGARDTGGAAGTRIVTKSPAAKTRSTVAEQGREKAMGPRCDAPLFGPPRPNRGARTAPGMVAR